MFVEKLRYFHPKGQKKKKKRERGYWEFPEAPGGFPGGTSGKEPAC